MKTLFINFKLPGLEKNQSMLVENGEIMQINPTEAQYEQQIDLQNNWIIPGFIDNHCHLIPTGLQLQNIHLGEFSTKSEILEVLKENEVTLEKEKWLIADNYIPSKLPSYEQIIAKDLDKISQLRPILLQGQNGHEGVANTLALKKAHLDPTQAHSFNGIVKENIYFRLCQCGHKLTLNDMVKMIQLTTQKMSQYGITTACDMLIGFYDLEIELKAFKKVIEQGCPVRLRAFIQWKNLLGSKAISKEKLKALIQDIDPNQFKILGAKLFADGSIGAKTAAIANKYPDGTIAKTNYTDEVLFEKVQKAEEEGYAVSIHSIGEMAIDQVIRAYNKLKDPTKHRIEHITLLLENQIAQLAQLGCHCTTQPGFIQPSRVSYLDILGQERAKDIARIQSVIDGGISLSFSTDSPFATPNSWESMKFACNRTNKLCQSENVDLKTALNCFTKHAAIGTQDQHYLGQIKNGFLADFQVYDLDPTCNFAPKLLEVYKDGKLVTSNENLRSLSLIATG